MLNRGLIYVNQKSIESITTERNLFDSDVNPGFEHGARDMERMFSQLETHYPRLVESVESRAKFEHKDRINLVALICSLLIRSKHMGLRVAGSLNQPDNHHFINELTRQLESLAQVHFKHFLLNATHAKNRLNIALLAMMQNLYWLFFSYEMVFVHTDHPDGWWTTDEPVVYRYDLNDGRIFSDDTELYLPLTPTVLLFMHHRNSKVTEGRLRGFVDGAHVDASIDEYGAIRQLILNNRSEFIFFNREFKFKGPVSEFPISFQ